MRTTHTNQKWMIRLSWLRSNCTALSVSTLYDYEVTVGVRSHTQKHTRKCAHAYHALRTTKASDFFSLLLYSYILFLVVCFGLSSGINTKNWVCHKMWLAICSAPSTTHNPYHTKHAFCVIFFPPRLRSNRDGYKFNYIFVHAKRNGWLNGEKKMGTVFSYVVDILMLPDRRRVVMPDWLRQLWHAGDGRTSDKYSIIAILIVCINKTKL